MKKPILNKWQYVCELKEDWNRYDPFSKVFTFGIYKYTILPPEGGSFDKRHHKGFIITIKFWFPIASINIY